MTITREQQADLHRGDTVELTFTQEYDATTITARGVFPAITDWYDNYLGGPYTLTVVSRAPRPLYVNHPRTKPVPGDVALDEDADGIRLILRMSAVRRRDEAWYDQDGTERTYEHLSPSRRLRLLVDGETGQVVE